MGLPKVQGEIAKLWADVEMRFTPQGKAVASVPLVFNKRKLDKATGEWADAGTVFVRATAWEQLAENCAESLSKGDEVVVSGELSMREYERRDGTGKGQSLELNIWVIGPSLARATAKVNKVSRSGSQPAAGGPAEDPWGSSPAPASRPAADDEPPF
jgi:single-strand DNA-binding protein